MKPKMTIYGIGMSGMILLVMIIFYFIFGSDVWEYLPVWLGVTIFVMILGLFHDYIEYDARRTLCHFCKNKLGDDYSYYKSRYSRTNNDLWSHLRCIPNKSLRNWCKIQ